MVLMVPAAPGCRPRTGVHSVALPGVYFPGAPVPATLRSWVLLMAEVGFVIEARVVRVPVGRVAPGRWVGWQVGHRLVVQVAPKCWLQIRQGWRRWAAGWAGQEGWGRSQKHRLQERQRCLVCALQSRIPVHRRVARVRPRCLLGLQARVAWGVQAPAWAAQVAWMAWLPVPPPQATGRTPNPRRTSPALVRARTVPALVRARAPHARPPPDWPIPPLAQRFFGHPRHCQSPRHPVRGSIRALGCRSQSRTLLGWYPPRIARPALARWFPKRHSGLWRCAQAR